MNIGKFVMPNMIVDSSASFLRNVTFDSSVYLQGTAHISLATNDIADASTPYALVVNALGDDSSIQYKQLGSMAFETSTNYYSKPEVDGLISTATPNVANGLSILSDSSIGLGGVLNQNTTIDTSDYEFLIVGDGGTAPGEGGYLDIASGDYLDIGNSYASFEFDQSTAIVRVSPGMPGIKYDQDCSSYFTDRSLIDKAYADNAIAIVNATNFTYSVAQDASIAALFIYDQKQDASIAAYNAAQDASIAGKIDAVANVPIATGDASLFSYESANVAYLKKLLAGAGIVITEDVSTITISGGTTNVNKYTGTFDGTASASTYITEATHTLGTGPLSVTCYEGTQQVWPDIDCDAAGNIMITWSSGSLAANCKYVIMG